MLRLALILLVACPAALVAQDKVTFDEHVLPIFRAKCGMCHDANSAKGGLTLDNFAAAMGGGASGAVVEPGSVDDSRLWLLVDHKEQPAMPPKEPKLPDDQLATIRKWIEGGALENKNSVFMPKPKKASMTLAEVTGDKPEGPPPMPENVPAEPVVVTPRGNAVTALAASPWAPLVAVAGHQQVLLYDLNDFTLSGVLPFPEGSIHVLRFSRNGSLLLAGGGRGGQSGKCIVFDVKTGKRVFEIGSEFDAVLAADISSNHRRIALGGPKKIVRIYSTATGELQGEIKKHTDWITAVEFSPDGVLLATGDRSNGLFVWEADTAREFYNLTGHTGTVNGVSWRIDGNVLASVSEDATVRLWEMNNGTQVKSWAGHGGGGASVWFVRDGRIVSTGRDQVTKLWDQNGAQQRAFPALGELGLKTTYAEVPGYVLAGDFNGNVRVWNAADGVEKAVLVTNPKAVQTRLEEATAALNQLKAAADQANAQVAALQKGIADRQAASAAATKAAADATAAAANAEAARLEAEKNAAAVKANAQAKPEEKAAADKALADAAAAAKAASDNVVALVAAAGKAVADARAPEHQNALNAAVAAAKVATDALMPRQALIAKLEAQKALPKPQ